MADSTKSILFLFGRVTATSRTFRLLQIVHEYGKFLTRNPGRFDHEHLISISPSH